MFGISIQDRCIEHGTTSIEGGQEGA